MWATLSADPVARINSEYGLKERQFTSAVWASTVWEGRLVLLLRVSQIINFWSSATEPNRDSCKRCQATSSTTAVCPVKTVLASSTRFSLGVALISQRQMVWSSEAESKWPFKLGFHDKPYPSFWWPRSLNSKNSFWVRFQASRNSQLEFSCQVQSWVNPIYKLDTYLKSGWHSPLGSGREGCLV